MIPEIIEIVKERIRIAQRDRRWFRQRRLGPTVTCETQHGRMTIDTRDDVIGRILFERGALEYDMTQEATSVLRQAGKIPAKGTGSFLDIGANIGHITAAMLRSGQFSSSIAFEPDPNNFSLFRKNMEQNQLTPRVTAYQAALSELDGELEFELCDWNFGDHRVRLVPADTAGPVGRLQYRESDRRVIKVPARRLDSVLAELPPELRREIALIWIDVQGHERHVFGGATELLERGVPIVAEFWPYGMVRAGTDCESYCRFMERFYRECWVYRGGRFIRYPITVLPGLWEEKAPERDAEATAGETKEATVIFTN